MSAPADEKKYVEDSARQSGPYYLQTDPGSKTVFSPSVDVEDYRAWLLEQIHKSTGSKNKATRPYGAAQAMQGMRFVASKTEISIVCIGKWADECGEVVKELVGGHAVVKAIGGAR